MLTELTGNNVPLLAVQKQAYTEPVCNTYKTTVMSAEKA